MERGGNILLVDDNDDDAFFVERAFKSVVSSASVFRCIDGREAQKYLEGEAPFADRGMYPLPDLILLDLKIPNLSGLEVLRWIRRHPTLSRLIVIMLTGAAQQGDIDEAYALQAHSFLIKSVDPSEMAAMARAIQMCWLRNLPSGAR
jgi:CheY-like chemotaxis protein